MASAYGQLILFLYLVHYIVRPMLCLLTDRERIVLYYYRIIMFMQIMGKLCIVILALFIIWACVPAYADQGGYTVRPMTPEEVAGYLNDSANHPAK